MMINFKEISDKCVKCGKCIQVCTIHDINRDEVTSPRGFLDLVGAYERDELKLDKTAKNIFESCFLCTNCVSVCPSSLRVDTAIEQIRRDIAQKYGIAWYKKAFFWLLRHRTIMDICAKIGYVFQSCAFKIKDRAMSPRFSLPMVKKERLLPTASKKSFLNSHPEFIDNGGDKTIGIFIGCMGNYAYTEIGEGLLTIAKALNLNVRMMKKQACCGAPAYFTGDFDTVDHLAKKNIIYFEKILNEVDAIIIPEATCSAMIKVDYEHFFASDDEWKNRAINVSKKIFMATEYFEKFTNLKQILSQKRQNLESITYHDACHARKMQGVYKEPRALLAQNFKLVEMSDSNVCCGFGGVTMQAEKYHLSRAAGQTKAVMIEKSGADVVSAECSACKMQLSNALHIKGSIQKVKNPIEIIADIFK